MYRRARRRTTRRQTRRIGLFAFLRRPLVQLAILALAALVIVAILFLAKPR
jgi:hypothetical protein